MENNKSYRIHTNINSDTVLNVHLRQDMDFLEILSLKLRQEELYTLHTSNYGVIIGRILASDAFGIPNVKVSIFIKLEDSDSGNTTITNFYPYTDISGKNEDGVRYNLLPDSSDDDCYRIVGTFPNKRLVLDENTQLEIFDKYWKYTTVTNKAGDYYIPHVPVGEAQLHIDFDISDVGILSQKPRDMIYKGYNNTLFDNANQFKEGTNLDNLTQIFSQNQSVYVYPFWGEDDLNEIAITRCDMNVQYKFEPTCIFMGAIVSDSYSAAVGHNCKAFRTSGYNSQLTAGEGTIEMIRKTPDGFVEEFQIQGNQLIDGDGIFCYQIPMNLDYVQTDEYGNVVPTDNPKKGIPTRTSVRFRVSMNETENDGVSRHRAKYLIPNNPKLKVELDEEGKPINEINPVILDDKYSLDSYYEFGTATNEDSYRDLFWNKVYTVKNYIPRVQVSKKAQCKNYTGIRTVNDHGSNNPAPFNKIRFTLSFSYRLSCVLATIVLKIICFINGVIVWLWNSLIGFLCNLCIPLGFAKICPFGFLCSLLMSCVEFPGLSEDDEGSCETKCYYPCCKGKYSTEETLEGNDECDKLETDTGVMDQKIEALLAADNNAVNLDFYNDWLNGALYMPLWYWKKTKKKKFFFGLFSKKAVNAFCNCDKKQKTKLMWNCAFLYNKDFEIQDDVHQYKDDKGRWHDKNYYRIPLNYGIIKEKETMSGLRAYYYAPGLRTNPVDIQNGFDENGKPILVPDMSYAVLFATDIVLLGSLNDCDLNGVPQFFKNLPGTTANIMNVSRDVEKQCDTEEDPEIIQESTGMDFWADPEDNNEEVKYGNGYFMNIGCNTVETLPKTCVNVERLSELGVSLDQSFGEQIAAEMNIEERSNVADGMITHIEIDDYESRAMFATMNHNGLQTQVYDRNLGYYFYKFKYLYPIDFDARMNGGINDKLCEQYTQGANEGRITTDAKDRSYLLYRQGKYKFFYDIAVENALRFPVYNNSFYFYFGLTQGKTAIDKFNTKFFSECVRSIKEPFNYDISVSGSSWYSKDENCEIIEDKLGKIEITLDGISTPYTYTISNSYGEEILKEVECERDTLIFDKYFDSDFLDENGEETENTTCYEVPEEEPKQWPIVNDTYTITITDSKGQSITQDIELAQNPISIEYETVDLGTKFYAGQTTEKEICGIEGMCGALNITNIILDGVIYEVNNEKWELLNEKGVTNGEKTYTRTVLDDEGNEIEVEDVAFVIKKIPEEGEELYGCDIIVELRITPNQINDINIGDDIHNIQNENTQVFDYCRCGKANEGCACTEDEPYLNDESMYIPIWVPQSYRIEVIQWSCKEDGSLCEGDIKNSSSAQFTILNGKPFDMIVNDVLLKYIAGKLYDNPNFMITNNNQQQVEPDNQNSNCFGWFNINREVIHYDEPEEKFVYRFNEFENIYQNRDYWEEVIENMFFTPENNKAVTDDTYDSIIVYKLQSILNLSKATFVQADSNISFDISINGGRKPTLIKSQLPSYDAFTMQENTINPIVMQEFIFGSETTAQNDGYHPTIVGWNYKFFYPEGNYWEYVFHEKGENKKTGYDVNPLFNDKEHIGNYFAVFSDNGGLLQDTDDNCLEETTVYNQAPIDADAKIYDEICINGEVVDTQYHEQVYSEHTETVNSTDGETVTKTYKPYFRTQFIDRRLDYDLIVMTPYNGENLITLDKGEFDWTKGRVSGVTINGIELAYDRENYNIFHRDDENNQFEYHIQEEEDEEGNLRTLTPTIIYNDNVENKRFYEMAIKCGTTTIDIRDSFWAYHDAINRRSPAETYDFDDGNLPITFFNVSKTDAYIQANTNGDFNQENYPTIRLIDVAQVPNGNRTEFNFTACSYETDVTYDVDGNMQCICGKGDNLDFSVANDKSISFRNPLLSDCISNSYSNVEYEPTTNLPEFTSTIMSGKTITLKFTMVNDSQATHNIRSKFPRLARIVDTANTNPIKELKKADTLEEINQILKDIPQLALLEKPDNIEGRLFNDDNEVEWTYLGYNDDTSDVPLEDDTIEFSNCVFGALSIRYQGFNIEVTDQYPINDAKFLCVVLDKEYFNDDSQDFLQKTIRVINTSNMYDVKPYEWSCIFAGKAEVQPPPSSGGTGGGTVEVPETQVIVYDLTFDDPEIYNQLFWDRKDMNFAIKYTIEGADYVIENLVPLMAGEEYDSGLQLPPIPDGTIRFIVSWNGVLKDIYMNGTPIPTEFYYKCKNSLIYSHYFTHRANNENDTVMRWEGNN